MKRIREWWRGEPRSVRAAWTWLFAGLGVVLAILAVQRVVLL